MKFTIKTRLYILAILPLLFISIGMMFFTRAELQSINNDNVEASRMQMMDSRKVELTSYMEIVNTVLSTLKENDATLDEVVKELAKIKFGENGYIYGYNTAGKRVLLGQSNKGLGTNYWNLKDQNGFLFIQDIINGAKKGGVFTTFYFSKPGEEVPSPKLAYSIYESEWDLVIGTGFYIDGIDKTIAKKVIESQHKINDALITIATTTFVILLFIAIFVTLISRSILKPLRIFDASIADFASGEADLTARMDESPVPEFKRLAGNFNLFVEHLQLIIKSVSKVSEEVAEETSNMSNRTSQVNSLIREQREETEQVAAAMTEMTSTAHEISDNATQAEASAQEAESNANETLEIVNGAVSSVMALADDVNQASDVVSRLEGDVQNISSSLEVIQNIAEQTNLLALNAAIEAARAGEQGRGFSVVADEVRKLASRTQESTLDIHKMIEQLKAASDDAVKTMENSRTRSSQTVDEASAASEALGKIHGAINTIMEMNALIATATEEQSQVGHDISERVVVISDKSNKSSELATQNASVGKELNKHAKNLSELVGQFTV